MVERIEDGRACSRGRAFVPRHDRERLRPVGSLASLFLRPEVCDRCHAVSLLVGDGDDVAVAQRHLRPAPMMFDGGKRSFEAVGEEREFDDRNRSAVTRFALSKGRHEVSGLGRLP
ncbi:MAG TPA: hypothetical protein VGI39_43435 [Polyangiaceae bacterium]